MSFKIHEFLKNEWPALKAAPFSFVGAFIMGGVVVCGLYSFFIIPGKDATAQALQAQLAQAKSGGVTASVKKNALLLAEQIGEFAKGWKDTDSQETRDENVSKYLVRFGLRASIMRDELDRAGQQSDALDKMMYDFSRNYQGIQAISSELERLAHRLPDSN